MPRQALSALFFCGVLAACGDTATNLTGNTDLSDDMGDFPGLNANALLAGPGGNEQERWTYGAERPLLSIQRQDNGICILDNGLVSVIDMRNDKDEVWEATSGSSLANTIDDHAFPAFSFLCGDEPFNEQRKIEDEYGVWTYSTLNDAMHYGNVVYQMFYRHLGEPPLKGKIRLRVHYGNRSSQAAYWDGGYANFGDAYPFYYSMASLDLIAHEIAHGVLDRISRLKPFETELSQDAKTLHEAFADISGVMAEYQNSGVVDWVHGQGFYGRARYLNKVKTEASAISSYLEYDDAGDNYYLRIGLITYPFYLLSQQWGLSKSYAVYIEAAKNCWTADTTLLEAAACIQQSAIAMHLPKQAVVDAFATVDIDLNE